MLGSRSTRGGRIGRARTTRRDSCGLQPHRGTTWPASTSADSKYRRDRRPEANCATRPAHAIAASARPTQPGQLPKPPPDPQPTVTATTTATKCSGASPTIQLGTKEKLEPTGPRSGRREVSESTSATTPTAKHAQLTLACYR